MEGQEIRCRAIIEVLGKPKEHVENSIRKYVEEIERGAGIGVIKKDFAEAAERDDVQKGEKYYSTFVELELSTKNIRTLVPFCFNYMPSSIEILEPEQISLKNIELSGLLNDLQARSHEVDRAVKEFKSQNTFLKRNTRILLQNVVLISLKINSLSLNNLSRATGIKGGELKLILEDLIKNSKIEKKGGVYCLKQA